MICIFIQSNNYKNLKKKCKQRATSSLSYIYTNCLQNFSDSGIEKMRYRQTSVRPFSLTSLSPGKEKVITAFKRSIKVIIFVCSSGAFTDFYLSCTQHTALSWSVEPRLSENPWQLIYQGRPSQQRSSSFLNAQGKYFN